MLVQPAKPITLKEATYILLSMNEYDGYSIDSVLVNRYNLISNKIPLTPTLRAWLRDVVGQFIDETLDDWSTDLRIDDDVSDESLAEMMEQNFDHLFDNPNTDVKVIETSATHRMQDEMNEAARAFILEYYSDLSEEDRQDFLDQFTEDRVLKMYFDTYLERFEFHFSDEPDFSEDEYRFACGYVVVEPEDIEKIFIWLNKKESVIN